MGHHPERLVPGRLFFYQIWEGRVNSSGAGPWWKHWAATSVCLVSDSPGSPFPCKLRSPCSARRGGESGASAGVPTGLLVCEGQQHRRHLARNLCRFERPFQVFISCKHPLKVSAPSSDVSRALFQHRPGFLSFWTILCFWTELSSGGPDLNVCPFHSTLLC